MVTGGAERATQYVRTTLPRVPPEGQTLTLPGTLQGSVETPINARASGYLVRWTKEHAPSTTVIVLSFSFET